MDFRTRRAQILDRILADEMRDHFAGRCSCTYAKDDPDNGPCVAAERIEGKPGIEGEIIGRHRRAITRPR